MDLASVVVPEAGKLSRTVVVRLACLFPVIFLDPTVVRPRIADILETGISRSFILAVAVVYAGFERRLLRRLSLLVHAGQLLHHFGRG